MKNISAIRITAINSSETTKLGSNHKKNSSGLDKQDTAMTGEAALNYEKALNNKQNDKNDTRKREELYNSIVEDIKRQYDYNLTETEAHEAARNLIDFVRELLKPAEKK